MNRNLIVACSCTIALISAARGEEPIWRASAATKPAAALGAPVPAASPSQARPVVRGQQPDLILPPFLSSTDEPKRLPKAEVTEDKGPKLGPEKLSPPVAQPQISSAMPAITSSADCDGPALGGWSDPAAGQPASSAWYGSAEYLLWWTRSMSVPVLLTTGPTTSSGILGVPGVTPLFGGDTLDPSVRSGARFNIGRWFACSNWGVDASLFFLGDEGTSFNVNSQTVPLIARPFFAPNTTVIPVPGLAIPGPLSEVVAAPGISVGGASVRTDTMLWGADINARRRGPAGCGWRLDWLGGYRFLHLTEDLQITETFSGLANPFFPAIAGINGSITDRFRTSNQFHGAQIGAIFERERGRWVFDVRTKVAFGVSIQSADIEGSLTQFGPNFIAPAVPGGLLALNSNIGHYSQTMFAVVPEVNLNIGYNVTERCRVFVGYSFLYWSNVLRPGDQIDTTLDLTRIPIFTDPRLFPATAVVRPSNIPRPAPTLKDTDYWAQGLNFGVRLTW